MINAHHILLALAAAASLGACARLGPQQPEDTVPVPSAQAQIETAPLVTQTELTAAPPPPQTAATQEALDTTTPQQRAQASAAGAAQQLLGTTVATLGSPVEPGFWLETPLVKKQTTGRVTNLENGKSSAVTLIPIEGAATSGSRLSLPAMRLIEAPLTELVELEVSTES